MSARILHFAPADKFIPPFIKFIAINFHFDEHVFFVTKGMSQDDIKTANNVFLLKRNILTYISMLIEMHRSKKIIMHGMFTKRAFLILFLMPWLLKKSYWVMWGGDLYVDVYAGKSWKKKTMSFIRGSVIKRMAFLVTYIKGDYELAKTRYAAQGKYQECLMYPSNLYKEHKIDDSDNADETVFLIGNSANPSNNQLEVLEELSKYKDEKIKIYAPLSYGDENGYKRSVILKGEALFGGKFVPLTEFILFDDYLKLLSQVDIAIFNHKRQQAMGNTITLLGLGKKVFLRSDVTQWDFFKEKGLHVYDIKELDIEKIKENIKESNRDKIKSVFSKDTYMKQLKELFA